MFLQYFLQRISYKFHPNHCNKNVDVFIVLVINVFFRLWDYREFFFFFINTRNGAKYTPSEIEMMI